MGVAKDADAASVSAGDQIGFTITLTNSGAGIARSVSASDLLPATPGTAWTIDAGGSSSGCKIDTGTLHCSLGALAPKASRIVHLTAPTGAAACGSLENTAAASATN